MVFFTVIALRPLIPREKKIGWSVLSQEYGKIDIWLQPTKKDPCIDIGALLSICVERSGEYNRVKSWHIRHALTIDHLASREGIRALSTLALVERVAPSAEPNPWLFADTHAYIMAIIERNNQELASLILTLKIVIRSGILQQWEYSQSVTKLLKWLPTVSSRDSLRLRWMDESTQREIAHLNDTSLASYFHG